MKHQNPFGVLVVFLLLSATSFAQSSQFTFQGKLTDGGVTANGTYDLTFKLFNQVSVESRSGPT